MRYPGEQLSKCPSMNLNKAALKFAHPQEYLIGDLKNNILVGEI